MDESSRYGEPVSSQRLQDLEALVHVIGQINRSLNLDDVLKTSLTGIQSVVNADCGCLILYNLETNTFDLKHYETLPPALRAQFEQFIIDAQTHSDDSQNYDQAIQILGQHIRAGLQNQHVENFVILPLTARNQALGILIAIGQGKLLAPPSVDLLTSIGEQIGMAIENARLHARIAESEAWSREFINYSIDGFVEIELDSKISFVNDAACRMFGYERETLLRMNVNELIASDEPFRLERLNKLLEQGHLANPTAKFYASNREIRIASTTTRVVRDQAGKPRGYQTILRDVTEQYRALDTLKQRNAELDALNAVANILSNPLDFSHALDQICERIVSITGMESSIIYFMDESREFMDIFAHRGITNHLYQQMRRVGLDDPPTRYVAVEGNPFAVDDLTQYPGEGIAGPRSEGYRAGIAVPIFKRDTSVGMIEVGSKSVTKYDQADIGLLLNIGKQIGKALETSELYNQMDQRVKELGVINAIAEILNHPLEIKQAIQQVCEKIGSITSMESVSIHLNDANNQFLYMFACQGFSEKLRQDTQRVGLDDPAARYIAVEGHSFAINDVSTFEGSSFAGPKMEDYRAGIGVPILKRQVPVGAIFVGSKVKNEYKQSDVDLLLNIGRQVGVALENAELITQMERRIKELDGLAQLSTACTGSLDPLELSRIAVDSMHKLAPVDFAVIRLLQDGEMRLAAQYSRSNIQLRPAMPVDETFGPIVTQSRPLVVDAVADSSLPEYHRQAFESVHIRAIVVVPITTHDHMIGALAIAYEEPHNWQHREIELAQTVANQVAIAIQNAMLFAQMQRRIKELGGLAQLSAACSGTLDPVQLTHIAVDWMHKLLPVDFAIIRLLAGDKLQLTAHYTRRNVQLQPEIDLQDALISILHNPSQLAIADIETSNLLEPQRQVLRDLGIRAIAIVPMLARDHAVGVLAIAHEQPYVWQRDEINLIQTVANQVAGAIDSAQLFQNVLREQRKVQAIFDSSLSGLFATDALGRIVMYNHAAESITGWLRSDVLGHKWEDFFSDLSQDPPIEPLINHALYRKQTLFAQEGRKIRTRDGRAIPAAKAVAPLLDEKGNVIGAVGAFWDLSREKAAEIQHEEFLKQVAHQLRSPLTAVLSAMQLLERPNLSEERRAEMWAILKNDGDRLKRFADQFLDLEAITKSQRPVHLVPLAIANVARKMVRDLRANQTSHYFHVKATPKNLMVTADVDRVENVLQNLLDNAIAYSPENTRITITLKPYQEDMVDAAVRDQGPGIPLEDHEKIFTPFYRSTHSEKRKTYGHGLGLSIAKRSVEEMGGRIWVESKLGQGATFHFTLRRYK